MTQRDQILACLLAGETLTPLEALSRFGCMALSQRCGELKRLGYPIVSELVREGGKQFARYSMEGQMTFTWPKTTKAPDFSEALASGIAPA